jgi:hypothetical protein
MLRNSRIIIIIIIIIIMAVLPFYWALAAFSVPLSYTESTGLLDGDQPVARPLPTHRKHKNRVNSRKHPCLEWDSNQVASQLYSRG